MNSFPSITGVITAGRSLAKENGHNLCSFLLDIETGNGPASVLLTTGTYVYDCENMEPGHTITVFYDPNAPVPLIYPPRYEALVIAETDKGQQAVLDVFDDTLTKSDKTLRLTLQKDTDITTPNGQKLHQNPGNHLLLVLFSSSTKSIPALTVPEDIVVFCDPKQ